MVMRKKSIPPKVIVFATDQFSSERLIRSGKKLATEQQLGLHILSIQPPRETPRLNADALEHLMQVARQMDAGMSVLYAPDLIVAAVTFLKRHPAAHMVLGISRDPSSNAHMGPFVRELKAIFPLVPLHLVEPSGIMITLPLERFSLAALPQPVIES